MKQLINPPLRPPLDRARDDAAYTQAHAEIDEANRAIIAAVWDAAQAVAMDGGCPACGSTLVTVFDIEERRTCVCRSCGERWS